MYSNYKGPFSFRVKRFGRVLGPLSSGSAALGTLFLGRGQPVDDKGGPAAPGLCLHAEARSTDSQDRSNG